ncbi:MAG: BMP family protein [Bacillota bacterium]
MKKFRTIALLLGIIMILGAAAACSAPPASTEPTAAPTAAATEAVTTEQPTPEAPKVRVAVIFGGPITDLGWNQDSYETLMKLQTEYNLDVSFQENVSAGDAKDVIRNYASEGYNLVVSSEQYHTEAMAEAAKEFPDVTFGLVNGYMGGDNLISITGTNWQASYLAGVLAGYATESGKIGILTATESPTAKRMANAYAEGAKITNPDVEMIHAFVGSFNDVVKGKELVASMIEQGVDVLYSQSGAVNAGAVEACKEAGIKAIGAIVDMSSLAPDTVLASAMLPPGNILRMIVEGYLDGSMKGSPNVLVYGLKEGVEELRFNEQLKSTIPQDVLTAIDKARQDVIDGVVVIPEVKE